MRYSLPHPLPVSLPNETPQGVADQAYKRGKAEKDLIVERMKERQRRRMAGAFVWYYRVWCHEAVCAADGRSVRCTQYDRMCMFPACLCAIWLTPPSTHTKFYNQHNREELRQRRRLRILLLNIVTNTHKQVSL